MAYGSGRGSGRSTRNTRKRKRTSARKPVGTSKKSSSSGYSAKTPTEYGARAKRRANIIAEKTAETNKRKSVVKAARGAARRSGKAGGTKQGRGPRIPGTR